MPRDRRFHAAISILALTTGLMALPAAAQTATPSTSEVPPKLPVPTQNPPVDASASGGATGTTLAADQPAGTQADAATPNGQEADIVVTGFRSSLNNALAIKKQEAGIVDTILAEDIGKFPDSNLAESMQRVPGVSLARGDGGEGKNISVRGLGAGFTRVRLNGMEGTSQTGSSDILGAGNRGRSFDFNVFASELFNSLSVRKTSSADTEEGSLGATVDLQTPHPLDYSQDFVLAASAQGLYNTQREKLNPRLSGLISKQFAGGTIGVLGSLAWTRRNTREEGYSAVNILRSTDDGGFCSPLGFSPQNPAQTAANAAKGTSAANCATGVPRTSSTDAYNLINKSTVFHPRIPRYVRSEQDYDRVGATASIQWAPDDNTKVSLDGLYSVFDVERRDNYIAGLSFGRGVANNGKPSSSVIDASVTPGGTLEYGLFNGVDVRSEGLIDRFKSTFKQLTLSANHKFSDTFEVYGLIGRGQSIFDNPLRTTINLDSVNANGFSYDFRDRDTIPLINFGVDVTNPASFAFGPTRSDGTVLGNITTRTLKTKTNNQTNELNALWDVADGFKLRFGGQYRESDFRSVATGRASNIAALVPSLPAGTTLADLTRTISGFGRGLGADIPSSWIAADYAKFNDTFGISDKTGLFAECDEICGNVGDNVEIRERVSVGYGQVEFDTGEGGFDLPFVLRGNAGVRYVHTAQRAIGYLPIPAAPGGQFTTTGQEVRVDRSYDDWLPSANLTFELSPKFLVRAAAARVMSRPELGQLSPGGSFNTTTRNVSSGNPLLDPIRATALDLSAEWYFQPGGILSAGFFYKDISSYIQSITSVVPFSETGLPEALLQGSASLPTDLYTVTAVQNTPGGTLKGVEINYQQPFTFLPGFLSRFGTLLNYTYVQSRITYILASANGVPTQTTVNDLIGLSKNAASGTLYYEDKKFSIRGTASYRDKYIRAVPSGGPDSDILGNKSTLFVDASASYQLTDFLRFTVEAQNLTDERNTLYIDSKRQDPLFETRIGRSFTFGAALKF